MGAYDPRKLGARCDLCILGPEHNPSGWLPVPPEDSGEATVAAIGTAPGVDEEREMGPYRGRAGALWDSLNRLLGIKREQVALFNLLSCKPAQNKFDILKAETKKANAGRRAKGLPELVHPAEACLPRLIKEIEAFPYLFTLGGNSTQYLTGEHRGILAVRGVARPWNQRLLMPTIEPAFVLRRPHYAPVLTADLRRGFRTFSGTLQWDLSRRTDILEVPGRPVLPGTPTPAQRLIAWFEEAIRQGAQQISYDVETDGRESPTTVGLRTLALAYKHAPLTGRTFCPECWGGGVVANAAQDEGLRRALLTGQHVFASRARLGIHPFEGEDPAQIEAQYHTCPYCRGCGQVEHQTRVTTCTIAFKAPDPMRVLEVEQGKRKSGGRDIRYMSEAHAKEVFAVLRWAFEYFAWIGHNAGYYDRMVVEQERYVGTSPKVLIDTIQLARANNAELDKTLGVWGTIFTDVPSAWKADNEGKKKATASRSVVDLTDYNETDSVVTLLMAEPMWTGAVERGYLEPIRPELRALFWDDANAPRNLYEVDLHTQALACDMHRTGQFVDQEEQQRLDAKLSGEMAEVLGRLRKGAREACGREDLQGFAKTRGKKVIRSELFNPGSTHDVADFLYDIMDLPIKRYTEANDISVDDEAILEHLLDGTTPLAVRAWLLDLRRYRSLSKILGTYIRPYSTEDSEDAGLIWSDGRVHCNWNSHTPNVGRFSSSGPNLQNILKLIKRLYVAQPGHVLVGCDLDQAHLRIIANEWDIPLFTDAFLEGVDPHGRYASWIYSGEGDLPSYIDHPDWALVGGYDPRRKPPSESTALINMRNAAKAGIYIFLYMAEATTAYRNVRSTPGKDGVSLPFLDVSEALIEHMRDELLANQPFEAAWDRIRKQHKRDKYLSSYLFGRRSDVATYKGQEEVNFPVLATESDIMRIVEYRVRKEFGYHRWGPGTGIINQCHDSITVEVPIELAEWAHETLLRCFTVNVPGWRVPVTASADIGWFADEKGIISLSEREAIDAGLRIPPKSDKGVWRYKTDFGGRLRSRWYDT